MTLAINVASIDFVFVDKVSEFKKNKNLDHHIYSPQNQLIEETELTAVGVLNLANLIEKNDFENALSSTIHDSIHFLDNCIEKNFYPLEKIKLITKSNRRLCLSVIGLEQALTVLNPEGGLKKSQQILKKLARVINRNCHEASSQLADQRGGTQNTQFNERNYRLRHSQILGQISTPLLCQIANTPSFLFKKSMTLNDFYNIYPLHTVWQDHVNNLVSFKTPIKKGDGTLFTKLFINAYQQGALSFEIPED